MHVLLPLKPLGRGKSRLAELLSREERSALVRAMLVDVLGAVRAAAGVSAITVVSAEPTLAAEHGLGWWDDRGAPWNDALAGAIRDVVRDGAVAIVLADLPLLEPEDVEALVEATPARGIALARATGGGTNAVCMRPAAAIETRFGEPGSAALHTAAARARGLDVVVLDRPATALDIDAPEDVERFLALERPTETHRLLDRLLLAR